MWINCSPRKASTGIKEGAWGTSCGTNCFGELALKSGSQWMFQLHIYLTADSEAEMLTPVKEPSLMLVLRFDPFMMRLLCNPEQSWTPEMLLPSCKSASLCVRCMRPKQWQSGQVSCTTFPAVNYSAAPQNQVLFFQVPLLGETWRGNTAAWEAKLCTKKSTLNIIFSLSGLCSLNTALQMLGWLVYFWKKNTFVIDFPGTIRTHNYFVPLPFPMVGRVGCN